MSAPNYQPEIGGEHKTGYVKTLVKSKEFIKDLEKMEFLSRVLTNPQLIFYKASPGTAKRVDPNYKVVLERRKN